MKAECSNPKPCLTSSSSVRTCTSLNAEREPPIYIKTDIASILADRQERCIRHVKRFGTGSDSIRRCFIGKKASKPEDRYDGPEDLLADEDDLKETFCYEGELLKIQAPMVRCSRPPFRKLCRLWGTDISYTHMILADCFVRSEAARQVDFALFEGEDKLITQFAAKSGPTLAQAAAIVSPYTDGIDINCGCPQRWAMKDGYGSALLAKPELVADMVSCVSNSGACVPCVVKMRVYDDLQTSVEFARRAEKAGAGWLTIHGRTPSCTSSALVRHDAIKLIRENVSIPVVANGGVRDPESAIRLALETGVGGVMSAQGLLDNPAAFDKESSCFREVVRLGWDRMPVLGGGSSHHNHEQQQEKETSESNLASVSDIGTEGVTSSSRKSFWEECYGGHFSIASHPHSIPSDSFITQLGFQSSVATNFHFHSAVADIPPLACVSDFCRLALHTELPYKTTQHHLLMMAHKLLSPSERIYVSEQPSIAGIVEYLRQQGIYVPQGRYSI